MCQNISRRILNPAKYSTLQFPVAQLIKASSLVNADITNCTSAISNDV